MDNSDFNIDRLLFYNPEAIEQGDSRAEAYEEGVESGIKDMILNMLRMNFDVAEIAKLSHKPISEINTLKLQYVINNDEK